MPQTAVVLTLTGEPHEGEALDALRAATADSAILFVRAGDVPVPDPALPVVQAASLWSRDAVLEIVDALLATGAPQLLWCLPPAPIVDPAAGCLCPRCLEARLSASSRRGPPPAAR
jgi:hypothetical protein